jgi:hypothetical protein
MRGMHCNVEFGYQLSTCSKFTVWSCVGVGRVTAYALEQPEPL